MATIFQALFMLMLVVWFVAVVMRKLGLPTIMGELIMGVVIGPAALGWVQPSEIIEILAQIGIFFLMLHTGVETEPRDFFEALKNSLALVVVGAVVPFFVSVGVARAFGYEGVVAVFVGLTMTATAVVITLKILRDLGLHNTRFARVIVASCVIDSLLSLVIFSFVLGILQGEAMDFTHLAIVIGQIVLFFAISVAIGYYLYPKMTFPFRDKNGKGFTFVLVLGFAGGLFAQSIGLHIMVGAYIAGLFFEEKVVNKKLYDLVNDRLYGLSYSFLGPIFFISLGFHITFNLSAESIWMLMALTTMVLIGQIISAGLMARRMHFTWLESLTVGAGMCGRAEMAFILASVGIDLGILNNELFSVLVFTAFLLNLLTPLMLKGCAVLLERYQSQWPY
jgi:Kef-type K+ transport system membrane component KefB